MLLWTCTQSFIASPRIKLYTQSLRADLSMCVLAKSGIASQAASFYHTSQYPWSLHRFLLSKQQVWLRLYLFLISSWQLHFIQSDFKGQLPQQYASGPLATQIIPANMNDQNLEEPSRYVSHWVNCQQTVQNLSKSNLNLTKPNSIYIRDFFRLSSPDFLLHLY